MGEKINKVYHPGIIVGRLKKEKRIPYSKYNHLKCKYEISFNK